MSRGKFDFNLFDTREEAERYAKARRWRKYTITEAGTNELFWVLWH